MQNTDSVTYVLALQSLEEDARALHGITDGDLLDGETDYSFSTCASLVSCEP
jgi:hypothetical protein